MTWCDQDTVYCPHGSVQFGKLLGHTNGKCVLRVNLHAYPVAVLFRLYAHHAAFTNKVVVIRSMPKTTLSCTQGCSAVQNKYPPLCAQAKGRRTAHRRLRSGGLVGVVDKSVTGFPRMLNISTAEDWLKMVKAFEPRVVAFDPKGATPRHC